MRELPWASLVQPDNRSCGASSLVVARMLADPAYAASMGVPPEGTRGVADPGQLQGRFRDEVLSMHRRVTSSADSRGQFQIPWPRRFGTPPWAVATQLSATPGADGTTAPYSWRPVRTAPATGFDLLTRSSRVGALFVGNDWLPRHIALVLDTTSGRDLRIYDPARGRLVEVDRDDFTDHDLEIAGWDVPWFVVTPDR